MSQVDQEVAVHCLLARPYKGFVPTRVGGGSIILRGPEGKVLTGQSAKQTGWCNEAWVNVKCQVDKLTLTPSLKR